MARAQNAAPNNLPAALTSFVGREREIGELRRLLSGPRLLTLTGAGGSGKSRLALEVAAKLLERFPDGVWVVELAALAEPTLVPRAVASALEIPEQPGRTLLETLLQAVRSKTLLIFLDNCEHLLSATAHLTDALLRGCPGLRIMAASREPLGVAGEVIWRVPSLAAPDPARLPGAERLMEFEAVRLFTERARAARSDFRITADNAAAIALACHRLDGMPLAIELAAARVNALTVEQIATRLDDRFRLLTGGDRTALPRHRTLRAAMDWSYDLLSEKERTLLRRVSVFAGGWTLEATEDVCAGDVIERTEILDLLAQLVNKSLVVAEARREEVRYRLLETVRQYARDHLLESGEALDVRRRHGGWYRQMAEQAEPGLRGPRQGVWMEQLEVELDNLRAALQGFLDAGDVEAELELASILRHFWGRRGYVTEGRRWLDEGLRRNKVAAGVRTRALNAQGQMAFSQGNFTDARGFLTESLTLSRARADSRAVVDALVYMAGATLFQGEFDEARALLHESLAISKQLGDQPGVAQSLAYLGLAAVDQGDYATARARYQEALTIFRQLGDTAWCATMFQNLGHTISSQGEHAAARPLFEEGLRLARAIGFQQGIAFHTGNLAVVIVHEGDFAAARALLVESLTAFRRVGDQRGICRALEGFGILAAAQGRAARVAALLGAAEGLREAIAAPLPVSDRAHYEYDRYVAAARTAIGDEAFRERWAEGRAMSLDQAAEYALIEPAAAGSAATAEPADKFAAVLSPREREVAALVAQGLTNREIAARLVVTERTAEGHVQSILNKLGFSSRAQIAAWAVEHGFRTARPA